MDFMGPTCQSRRRHSYDSSYFNDTPNGRSCRNISRKK